MMQGINLQFALEIEVYPVKLVVILKCQAAGLRRKLGHFRLDENPRLWLDQVSVVCRNSPLGTVIFISGANLHLSSF